MPTAVDEFQRVDYQFYSLGLQYYVAGRFGALHWLSPVAANLLHHSLEMLLKGRLAHCYSLNDLKDRKKFGHNLGKCWTAFKAIFPTEDLSQFDELVAKLDEFEDLRYPDDILRFGAVISIGFVSRTLMGGPISPRVEPVYQLSITDLDALMDQLFQLCGINPEAYLLAYNNAVEFLEKHNVTCKGWFPHRELARQ